MQRIAVVSTPLKRTRASNNAEEFYESPIARSHQLSRNGFSSEEDSLSPEMGLMSNVLSTLEEPSRRSGRKRTVSKRLQDMELNFGSRKQQDEHFVASPKKKIKPNLNKASLDMEQNIQNSTGSRSVQKEKQYNSAELMVHSSDEIPDTCSSLELTRVRLPVQANPVLELQPLDSSTNLENETQENYHTLHVQTIGGSQIVEIKPVDATQTQYNETFQTQETIKLLNAECQSRRLIDPVSGAVIGGDDNTQALTDNPDATCLVNKQLTFASPEPDLSLENCFRDSGPQKLMVRNNDCQIELQCDSGPCDNNQIGTENSEAADSIKSKEECTNMEDGESANYENLDDRNSDAGHVVLSTDHTANIQIYPDNASALALDNQGQPIEVSLLIGTASETAETSIEKLDKTPDTPAPVAQFVMLDDDRQLLLSNADALATGADAMALLSQSMKDVQFVITQEGNEIAPAGQVNNGQVSADHESMPGGEVAASLRELVTSSKDNHHIRFVTVNAGAGTSSNTTNSKPDIQQQCNIDMVINSEGKLSAGPSTILSQDGFYRCSMCAYKTDKKANWYKHRYTHMSLRRYMCDKCDHKATTSSNLKRHMLIHSDTKVFKCMKCQAQFRQKMHLLRHINYRHNKKMVKCKHCDYVCSNVKPDLEIHTKRKHPSLDEFQFRCDKCGFNAASFRDLKQHQKFHRPGPELKLYCEQCSFVTDCESRLRRHLLVHNKLRPFWCSLCDYKASQKEHVMRHLRTKHKMEPGASVVETVVDQDGDIVTLMTGANMEQSATGVEEEGALGEQDQTWMVLETKDGLQQVVCVNGGGENPETTDQQDGETSVVNSNPGIPEKSDGISHLEEQSQVGQEIQHLVDQEDAELVEDPTLKSECSCQEQVESALDPGVAPYTNNGLTTTPGELGEETGEHVTDQTEHTSTDTVIFQKEEQSQQLVVKTNPDPPCNMRILGKRIIESAGPSQSDGEKVKKTMKKKYEPADFSLKEKVFSCIHCTMKFSKLINLYKHLSVQHKDVHATKAEGLHMCVWCEYQTNKWKNLLVHMRKHNFREEYGMMSTRYTCVVCTYSSQHRKALYAHMMKKHKIQIYVKPDGSASCVIDDTIPSTMSATDGSVVVIQRPGADSAVGVKPQSGIVSGVVPMQQRQGMISALNKETPTTMTQATHIVQHQPGSGTQMVMVELEPGMPATAVEIMTPAHHNQRQTEESVDHEAADAIEGLQALAEQVLAAQQQHQQIEGPIDMSGNCGIELESSGQEDTDTQTQIHIHDCFGQVMEDSNIQLTPEQLMQLTSGDYIEINGEMYKVEVAEEPAVK